MRILVVGSGGREHTIVWKLKQSQRVTEIYCAPGNGGIEEIATCVPISPTDIDGLIHFAKEQKIDLTVVGPEAPLLAGIVDRFEEQGLKIFGPKKAAARIEGSKRFAKELMQKYQIPTASFQAFTDPEEAKAYVRSHGAPIVIKADGLAAGKGVVVAQTVERAEQAIVEAMETRVFGDAGKEIVIEECLFGQEVSLMAFVDGQTIKPMVIAQDHKPVFDGDQGPNTGGMGAYSPVPQISQAVVDKAIEQILFPIAEAFHQEGIQYKGVLYAGLMITQEGPKVIEFNARFGDPETQVVLPRLKSDLLEVILAVVDGKLAEMEIEWSDEAAVCVVMAAGGYPGSYQTGHEITGIPKNDEKQIIFHAGTKLVDGKLVTAGGRVLGVTAIDKDIPKAQQKAYQMVQQISFPDAHYRKDIANKALN
ncbi:phosphoribosylamine--glycine ligase [Thermoflavimicrobium dichotomicum]|uniref:Phosphoribosylamine--glycine ligase n=1 Tax=Thermoflavimicrobium dichotomicum TaxID=46223 RepID=A0A1I3RJV6_9BACL|nr:phosphoribosylamine--glycine ligase [Thermoflavimicrobium dichotomicum]SFJ45611.1 phosphoribosylamine--glycine ligase [Thermoflavimicrobium dichotomicum]